MNTGSPCTRGTESSTGHTNSPQSSTNSVLPSNPPPVNNQQPSGKIPAAASSQKAKISFKKWEHTFPIPYQGPFLPSAMPSSPPGMACQSLDRASAQHGWTYLNVCTIGPQKHHYLVVVTAKISQNMKQIISIPTVLILQTDLLGEKKKRKRKRKICSTSPPSSSMPVRSEAAQTCSILLQSVLE